MTDSPNIFTFENKQCEGCGTPPEYDLNEYFVELGENEHGEQILCVRNKVSGQFHFHHGDCEWDKVFYADSYMTLSKTDVKVITAAYAKTDNLFWDQVPKKGGPRLRVLKQLMRQPVM
tara:strand:+ start:66 stop:419 length:354 start_codon:yes stop_codon:yes gene_type:complete